MEQTLYLKPYVHTRSSLYKKFQSTVVRTEKELRKKLVSCLGTAIFEFKIERIFLLLFKKEYW